MKKINIKDYSSQELVLLFNNKEPLYNMYQMAIRRNNFQLIEDYVNENYSYNSEQLEELEEYFSSEVINYELESK